MVKLACFCSGIKPQKIETFVFQYELFGEVVDMSVDSGVYGVCFIANIENGFIVVDNRSFFIEVL